MLKLQTLNSRLESQYFISLQFQFMFYAFGLLLGFFEDFSVFGWSFKVFQWLTLVSTFKTAIICSTTCNYVWTLIELNLSLRPFKKKKKKSLLWRSNGQWVGVCGQVQRFLFIFVLLEALKFPTFACQWISNRHKLKFFALFKLIIILFLFFIFIFIFYFFFWFNLSIYLKFLVAKAKKKKRKIEKKKLIWKHQHVYGCVYWTRTNMHVLCMILIKASLWHVCCT